jgi:hypothetical protein
MQGVRYDEDDHINGGQAVLRRSVGELPGGWRLLAVLTIIRVDAIWSGSEQLLNADDGSCPVREIHDDLTFVHGLGVQDPDIVRFHVPMLATH